jgi:hypothetical protein
MKYILCDCDAIAYLRFRYPGLYFMEPDDYHDHHDTPLSKTLHFVLSVRLLKS